MKRDHWIVAACAAFVLTAPAAWAGAPLAKDDIVRELGKLPVVIEGGGAIQLEVFVARPKAAGRYPLAIITHGTPRNPDASVTRTVSIMNYAFQAEDFARRGYVAATVMRRGYGESEGSYEESMGSCDRTNYSGAAAESMKDLRAAIEALKRRPDVEPGTVIAIGVSSGGFGVLALAARAPEGLRAVVNVAGGRGSQGPNIVCKEHDLVRVFGEFGKTSRIPTLWIYALNDQFFGPDLARRFHAAFTAGGASAEFVGTPAFGRDGHGLFNAKEGRAHWWGPVDRFLQQQKLPTWDAAPAEPYVPDHPPPAALSDKGKEAWRSYLQGMDNRAFATTPDGRFGWRLGRRTLEEAKADALKFCGRPDCKIVAENDRLVP